MTKSVPTGFEPHFRKSPLTDPWEPLFSKRLDNRVVIGLQAEAQHCNSRGFVHGGLISAIGDNAMGLSCLEGRTGVSGGVTISLHVDFVGVARIGDWLEFDTTFIKPGRSVSIAQGEVRASDVVCALMGATYKTRKVSDAKSSVS